MIEGILYTTVIDVDPIHGEIAQIEEIVVDGITFNTFDGRLNFFSNPRNENSRINPQPIQLPKEFVDQLKQMATLKDILTPQAQIYLS